MNQWVLLAYRLPREPSRPRLALWRAVRRLGATQVADGVVALPLTAETREHCEWLASAALEDGGEASVWIAQATTRDQDRRWSNKMMLSVEAEYLAIRERAEGSRVLDPAERARVRRNLRAEMRRVRSRDYFKAPGFQAATAAVEALGGVREGVRAR